MRKFLYMPVTLNGLGRWEDRYTCHACGKPAVAQAADVYTTGDHSFFVRCPSCQEPRRVPATDLPEGAKKSAPYRGDNRRYPQHDGRP